ncbi:hypothetical protein [Mammaliicoccus vitulinus]|uniref:hypothetical protein n=1 Tax=Mammaliicoccus vitulinus TaxID=71237 RepID=UPI003B9FFC4F
MATKSFTSEYRFTVKTAPKLIQIKEKEEKNNPRDIHAKKFIQLKVIKELKNLWITFYNNDLRVY